VVIKGITQARKVNSYAGRRKGRSRLKTMKMSEEDILVEKRHKRETKGFGDDLNDACYRGTSLSFQHSTRAAKRHPARVKKEFH